MNGETSVGCETSENFSEIWQKVFRILHGINFLIIEGRDAKASLEEIFKKVVECHADELDKSDEVLWGLYTHSYDLWHLKEYRKLQQKVIRSLDLQPGMRILNLGGATAPLETALDRPGMLEDIHVEMIERNPLMIQTAKMNCPTLNITQHDLMQPLPDHILKDGFDVAICTNVLGFLSPKRILSFLHEIWESLKYGGHLILTTQKKDFNLAPILQAQGNYENSGDKRWDFSKLENHGWVLEQTFHDQPLPLQNNFLITFLVNYVLLRRYGGSAPYAPTETGLKEKVEQARFWIREYCLTYGGQYHFIDAVKLDL